MKTKLIILSLVAVVSFTGTVIAGEGHDHKGSMKEEVSTDAVNVGNKICPVSGQEIGGDMGEGVEVEYEGKLYNLCCAMCAKDFKKDPKKYIEKINEELKNSGHGHEGHDHK